MLIETPRYILRDFIEADRAAFAAYQTDPRYRALYDIGEGEHARVHELFDLFTTWQHERPRRNFQLGIFERRTGQLCGSVGLRMAGAADREAELGVELAPHYWARYRMAVEIVSAVIDHGFEHLDLLTISGKTASGNRRVEKLARWFGAETTAEQEGESWMIARGWTKVSWTLSRTAWLQARMATP